MRVHKLTCTQVLFILISISCLMATGMKLIKAEIDIWRYSSDCIKDPNEKSIEAIVSRLARKAKLNEPPRVCVTTSTSDQESPNSRASLFHRNGIITFREQDLKDREIIDHIDAVIAHEIGHIEHGDSIWIWRTPGLGRHNLTCYLYMKKEYEADEVGASLVGVEAMVTLLNDNKDKDSGGVCDGNPHPSNADRIHYLRHLKIIDPRH